MGSADPRAYSRNKRGIAGSLIWINFDRHALLALFHKAMGKFVADVDEIRPQYQDSEVNSSAVFASSLVRSIGPSIGSIIDQIDNLSLQEVGGLGFTLFPACLPLLESTAGMGDDRWEIAALSRLLRGSWSGRKRDLF
jgi:hypothetical protein